ncbi:MAG: hypothetical protein CSH49_06940 [Alcanivorax sp.]|jgi:predicted small secreted protein|nr:hypothetical protein [Pseudomonadales bacterium]RLT91442.1 MAG: hypothetical protein D9N13_03650 [Ketobacter sp. GenoA1]TNC89495.1 MAG: hypothetical protein CSH49_06940 [Alcanivorax sp.]HBO92200.1 hypothetical protein [Gammaproteobacteria bacterium]|tara:strand:+ start:446 stop:673 length:228 start_codon:yes stop_codon:yes gene_type:complete
MRAFLWPFTAYPLPMQACGNPARKRVKWSFITSGKDTMTKRILMAALLAACFSVSGCTTCDLSLWFGDDVCAIGM